MEGSRKPLAKVEGRRRLRLSGVTVAWRGTPNLDDWVAYIVNGTRSKKLILADHASERKVKTLLSRLQALPKTGIEKLAKGCRALELEGLDGRDRGRILPPDRGIGVHEQLETVAVRVGQIDRLAHPVVGEPQRRDPLSLEVGLGRAEVVDLITDLERHVVEPHGVARGRGSVLADLQEREVVVIRAGGRSEEHTSELQSLAYLVCRLLLEKKKKGSPRPVNATVYQILSVYLHELV